jgi:hypothetical protein
VLNLPPVARQIWLADAIMNTPVIDEYQQKNHFPPKSC